MLRPQAGETAPQATIGQRIRGSRQALGLNQTALADRLGVTQPTVANWEAGVHDPRQLMLAKIAEALGVSLGWLAGGERSDSERDTSAAAPYVRRAIRHVPVLTARCAARVATEGLDPHDAATDYVPVTYGGGRLAAVFLPKSAVPEGHAGDTLFVVDYDRRRPNPSETVLIGTPEGVAAKVWSREATDTPIGTIIASIRFH